MRLWLSVAVFVLAAAGQAIRERALEHYRQREFAEAARALEQHLQASPTDTAARLLLGLSYQQAGDLPRAERAFREAPRRGDARFYLARLLFERARFSDAEAAAREALSLGYTASRVHLLIGLIRIEQARFPDALAAFAQAKPKEPEAWVQAGKLLVKMGRTEEAVRQLEEALRRAPDSAEAAAQLARARQLSRQPAAGEVRVAPVKFEDRTELSGVRFVLQNHGSARRYLPETMAGGLAVFDYDNDGRLDLFFLNGAPLPSMAKSHPRDSNRLYRNLGEFRFEDVTAKAGVAGEGFAIGVAAGDYDNDGWADLFVAGVGRSQLLRNRGGGTFEDVSARAGVRPARWAVGAGWFDYDGDGHLDLFVVNYLDWNAAGEPFCGDEAKNLRVYCHPRHFAPLANELYRNRGDGTFEDVSAKAGIGAYQGKGMSVVFGDYDGDGWVDAFVPNDTMPNCLFRNRGDGTFEENALEAGVAMTGEGKAISGMGADFRDVDNDGRPDLVFTALAGETFPLFRNTGKAGFEDWTYPSGLGLESARYSGWGVALADLNNDGWRDLVTANSHVTDNIESVAQYPYRQPSTIFLNRGGRFAAATTLGPAAAHRGLAVADLDNDGRLDIVTTVLGGRPELWRNVTESGNRWVAVETSPGQRVTVAGQPARQWSASGYGTSVLAPLHFGLGPVDGRVEIGVGDPLVFFRCEAARLISLRGEVYESAISLARNIPVGCQPVRPRR